jgi:ubiquinone/menaquinone biosynthesis C-methylase UbiE
MDTKRQNERLLAYSNISESYKNLYINELDSKPIDRKIYDLFFDRAQNKGLILEIGCGPGEISNYLWDKGLKITGIDLSEKMIAEAHKYNPSIPFEVGDVFNLKHLDNSISGIVAPYLIVNFTIKETFEAFLEIYRVLKQNSYFLLSFHIGNNNKKTFMDLITKGTNLTFTFFRVNTIKRLLKKTGFEITEVIIKEPYKGEITTRSFIFSYK